MKPRVTLRAALADKNLLGRALPGDSWKPWRTLLIGACGEELTEDERVIFKKSGVSRAVSQPHSRVWLSDLGDMKWPLIS